MPVRLGPVQWNGVTGGIGYVNRGTSGMQDRQVHVDYSSIMLLAITCSNIAFTFIMHDSASALIPDGLLVHVSKPQVNCELLDISCIPLHLIRTTALPIAVASYSHRLPSPGRARHTYA